MKLDEHHEYRFKKKHGHELMPGSTQIQCQRLVGATVGGQRQKSRPSPAWIGPRIPRRDHDMETVWKLTTAIQSHTIGISTFDKNKNSTTCH
jgi:hypothetical protein